MATASMTSIVLSATALLDITVSERTDESNIEQRIEHRFDPEWFLRRIVIICYNIAYRRCPFIARSKRKG